MEEEIITESCDLDEEGEVEKRFITSPADIETQRKVKLQDAYITEIDKARFRCLCKEFEDVFSKSSEDIGHTPFVTMDIDTGDSPPVCQKPYSVIVCPLGAVWAYYIQVPYLLVRHCKRLYTRLNKVTLCFSFGGSRQSLKVHEVKCIPRDPAITCPVLFKGSRSPLSLA